MSDRLRSTRSPFGSDDDIGKVTSPDSDSDIGSSAGAAENPGYIYLGLGSCRACFRLSATKGTTLFVCGSNETCRRVGHAKLREAGTRGQDGWYEVTRNHRYRDGLHGTHLTPEAYSEIVQATHAAHTVEAAAAASLLGDMESDVDTAPPGDNRKPASMPTPPKDTRAPAPDPDPMETSTDPDDMTNDIPTSGAGDEVNLPVDPLLAAMTSLRKDMMARLEQLEQRQQRKQAPLEETPRRIPRRETAPDAGVRFNLDAARTTDEPIRHFYAGARGRDGRVGIFTTWEEARRLVDGVSNAIYQRFRHEIDAMNFILSHNPRTPSQTDGPTWEETSVRSSFPQGNFPPGTTNAQQHPGSPYHGMQQGTYGPTGGNTNAELGSTSGSDHGGATLAATKPATMDKDLPTADMMGPDPSIKREDTLFNIEIGSERDLRKRLAPPGLDDNVERKLANRMIDSVAMPGTLDGGSDDVSELALMSAAFEELINAKNDTEDRVRSDTSWRQKARTSLRQITDLRSLQQRLTKLVAIRSRVTKHLHLTTRSILISAGWTEAHSTMWAHHGLMTRISRDAMDNYINLHFHLASQALEAQLRGYDGWKFVKRDVLHHTEALEGIRALYDTRLQAMCALYIYLRDGMYGGWHNARLQSARDLELLSGTPKGLGSGSSPQHDDDENTDVCQKCKTSVIHGTDKNNCPWKLSSAKKARTEAQKFIRHMAAGGGNKGPNGGAAAEGEE